MMKRGAAVWIVAAACAVAAIGQQPAQSKVPVPSAAEPPVVQQPTAPVAPEPVRKTGAALPADAAMPALSPKPTERTVPGYAEGVTPLAGPVMMPSAPNPELVRTENSLKEPQREAVSGLSPTFLGFFGPYRRPKVPELFAGDASRLNMLIRDRKLYLTLQDAIALALENNLDVEAERYNLVLAHNDEVRAAGGGRCGVWISRFSCRRMGWVDRGLPC